jgi:hypothetical protein
MKITVNDASVTRIIDNGKLVEEIPAAGRVQASVSDAFPEESQPADAPAAAKSSKGGK